MCAQEADGHRPRRLGGSFIVSRYFWIGEGVLSVIPTDIYRPARFLKLSLKAFD
jgi:hypothetical protein